MKTTMRSLICVVLAVAGGLAMLAGNARGAEVAMPPEVKALIGMKLPPKIVGRTPADIPGFYQMSGALIWTEEKQGNALTYDEGVVGDKWPVFIVGRISSDKSAEILDAQMLPANLIEWRLDNGNRKYLEGRYRFSVNCKIKEKDTRIILGLVKPEKGKSDCAHFSSRVKLAWQVDRQSGRITPMPTKGMKCEYITMSACY